MQPFDTLFGLFLDWAMRSPIIARERPAALKDAYGEVLELGFGTGLNLPHYPSTVTALTVVDPEDLLPDRIEKRIAASRFPVRRIKLGAERLPLDDNTFDCAVSTFTLCTIPDALAALREVRRVLKPEGSFLFLEHGLSDDASVAKWQHRLNPVQKVIARGCNLDRRMDSLIASAGLKVTRLDRFVAADAPRILSSLYRGAAAASK